MKLYVYDHGWSGADILVARNKETALIKLVDPLISHYRTLAEEHDKLYNLEDRPNPWWDQYNFHLKERDSLVEEYEIVDGLEIRTVGES